MGSEMCIRDSRRERELRHRVHTEGSSIHEGPLRGRQLGGKPRGGTSSRCSKKAHHRVGEGGGNAQVGTTPKVSRAKSINAGKEASTADVDQALEDHINEQRKEHRGCGSAEVMNKLLEIKPDALGAYPPMLRRRRQGSSRLGSTAATSVFAGAGSLVSVGVPAWPQRYP